MGGYVSQSAKRSASGDARSRFARLRAMPAGILGGDTMTGNAFGMVAGRVSAMGLGFVFWLLAAHAASQSDVGFAAAVIAAMMLCTQFAQLGLGSAVITLLPTRMRSPAALLDVTLTMTVAGSAVVAVAFLVIAKAWLPELGQVATVPVWTAAFIAICVFGTLGVVLDQVNVGLQRGTLVIHRTVAFGIITLAPVLVVLVAGGAMSAFELTLCWVAAGAGATFVGVRQLRGSVPLVTAEELVADVTGPPRGYRLRPRLDRELSRHLVTVGLANHLLTLCERAPGLVLPLVVTEILSPEATAVWYIVWMSAWVVFTAPISMGIAQFAASARRPEQASATSAAAIKASLIYAGGGAAILAILAPAVLHLLGPEYAQAGALPLRLLLIGVIPLAIVSAFYAYCRANRRFAEVLAVGTVAGAAAIVIPAVAATHYGLAGMAIAWVAVQTLVAMYSGIRLWVSRH